MEAAEAAALLAPLRPWLCVLMDGPSTCELKNPARTEHGVVFTFDASFHPIEDADQNAVVKLREAIDLAYRALSVHTALAMEFREERRDNMAPHMRGISEPSTERRLYQDPPFEMKIYIAIHQLKNAAVLKRLVADEFVTKLSQMESSDALYLAAKVQLDAVLEEKKPGWRHALVRRPIAVSFVIESPQDIQMTPIDSKIFFEHLTAFVGVLNEQELPTAGSQGHLPMTFEIAFFELFPVPITPEVATVLTPMLTMERARIKSTHVVIDPRLVTCSRKELGVFLEAIHAKSVELLPRRFVVENIVPMDRDVDIMSFISMLLSSICDCPSVDLLGCGVLFALFADPLSRSEIVKALVHIVLVRAQPLKLVLRVGETTVFDARLLTFHAQEWRSKNPLAKLSLKHLAIELYDLNGEFARAFVGVLDEVEELSITNHDQDAPRIPSQQVSYLLEKFSSLRKLSLGQVDLETMDVFTTNAPQSLESLTLRGVRLEDRPSFIEFVQDLGDPHRDLSQHLRELTIAEFSLAEAPVRFRLDKREVDCLASTLQSNRVLETVSVLLEKAGVIEHIGQSYMLSRAGGSVVPAPPSVRRSCEEKARRVAFLSVLHAKQVRSLATDAPLLDTFLVRRIFAFSDPWVSRSIHSD